MPREVWFEVHCEVDGHVTGSQDKQWAEKRAKEIREETNQETEVKKVVNQL